jgi:hypothetical protein
MLVVVEDERPGVVGVEDNCALVVAVVPIGVADVDVVEVVAAAVVDAVAVAVVGRLAAVQVATGRLVQLHIAGRVAQSCIQVRIDSGTINIRSPSTKTGNHCRWSEKRSI